MNLIDVNEQFSTDEQCLAYLEHMRWPGGFVTCPICNCERISRIARKPGGKNKRAQIYQCLRQPYRNVRNLPQEHPYLW